MSGKEEVEKYEVISEQEHEYGQKALSDFKERNYTGCLQYIAKLESKSQDFKVLLNKYIAEFYKSDLKKVDQFQKNLQNLCIQFNLRYDSLDDLDYAVAYFNQAILLYHQKQYSQALNIMDKVYKYIEPMDEEIGRKVGLLLVELHLCVRQADKAMDLIIYLHNHALNKVTPSTTNTTKVPARKQEKDKKPAPPITKATEEFVKLLEKYKLKCNLLKRNMKIISNDLHMLQKNNSEIINVDLMFFLANQQYLEGKHSEAMQTLASIPSECLKIRECGESSNVMFYNNAGVIYHSLGKFNLAVLYFQHALREDLANQPKNTDCPLYTIGSSRYHEIMYNLGISFLHAGKPNQAFDCLIIAVRRYHRNSRLWFRLAECCIQVHKGCNSNDFNLEKRLPNIVEKVVGNKEHRKIILNTKLTNDKKIVDNQAYAVPVPSIEFASLCLKNAQTLLPKNTALSPVSLLLLSETSNQKTPPYFGSTPSSPLDANGLLELQNAIYVSAAYVSICLGDYVIALESATKLLQQPKLSPAHKLLGHLYSAECLVFLNKVDEASEHLIPDKIKDISLILPDGNTNNEIDTRPPQKWFPNNTVTTQAIVQYNIAALKAINGNYEQSLTIARQLWSLKKKELKVSVHVLMLILYNELQLGRVDTAKSLINQYNLRRFGP